MHLSAAGLQLIKKFEGFRDRTYLDAEGFPTIGYGHKLLHPESFPNGIDQAAAEHILACDLGDAEKTVCRLVKVSLTQGQFDALVDFAYNMGGTRLAGSTLLINLNEGRYDEAGAQLLRWDHAGKAELPGLKERRAAELESWNKKGEAAA